MKKVILMVEDEDLVARMYQKSMQNDKFEVVIALNAREGIMKAEELLPDLIIMDIMMPGTNGIQAVEELKANPRTKHIPVIVLSNLSGKHDVEVAKEKGAEDYWVKKEVSPSEIISRVSKLIGVNK